MGQECANGNMYWCDRLYEYSPAGSEEELFGGTCGGLWPNMDYAGGCKNAESGIFFP